MKRVLVFGDAISDVYTEYSYKKECPDAPGVNAYVKTRSDLLPGGAANVATNLAMLAPNTHVDLIASLDVSLARAIKGASQSRVDLSHCVWSGDPLRKERVLLDGKLIQRLDNNPLDVGEDLAAALYTYFQVYKPDLIILSDYGGCALNERTLSLLQRERLLVDTKLTDLSVFEGCLIIKLNRAELNAVMQTEAAPERFCQGLVVTLSDQGAALHVRTERPHPVIKTSKISVTHTITMKSVIGPESVVDVCGCGDTFLAGIAASLLVNDDLYSAVQFGNAAAATVITKPRTAVADRTATLKLLGREET